MLFRAAPFALIGLGAGGTVPLLSTLMSDAIHPLPATIGMALSYILSSICTIVTALLEEPLKSELQLGEHLWSVQVCTNNSSRLDNHESIRPYNYRLYRATLASVFVAIYLCFVIWFRPNKKPSSLATTDQNQNNLATTNRPNPDNLPKISVDQVITHF